MKNYHVFFLPDQPIGQKKRSKSMDIFLPEGRVIARVLKKVRLL